MSEYKQALMKLGKAVVKMPLEEQTLWNEACLDMANLLEKYPDLLDATGKIFYLRLTETKGHL